MRSRARVMTIVGLGMALALLAFAGYFTSNGRVYPTAGSTETMFEWSIEYNLDEEEEPPSCYLKIWDGEWLIGSYMMKATTLEGIVSYTYSRTLSAGNYAFSFHITGLSTIRQPGPTVS